MNLNMSDTPNPEQNNADEKDGNVSTGAAPRFFDTDTPDAATDSEGGKDINNFGDEIEADDTGSGTMGSSGD